VTDPAATDASPGSTPPSNGPWGEFVRHWVADAAAPGSPRAAKHALTREVQRLIEGVALLDTDEGTWDVAKVTALTAAVAALALEVEPSPDARRRGLAGREGFAGALTERSGISGKGNPLAAPLHLRFEGERARGWATFGAAYEGPPGTVHGGFVAAAFDDMMGFAQMASGFAGYTGTLTVKMRRPTPLGRRIDFEAGLDRVDGRKIFCWGKSWDEDTLLCEATILFVAPRDGLLPG
jgi:hypothetical protein